MHKTHSYILLVIKHQNYGLGYTAYTWNGFISLYL